MVRKTSSSVVFFTHIVYRKVSKCRCSVHNCREFRNLSSNLCFTGRKVSLYLTEQDNITGGVPLMNINVTFIEASECDKLSTQVRKTNVPAMNEWTLLLFR